MNNISWQNMYVSQGRDPAWKKGIQKDNKFSFCYTNTSFGILKHLKSIWQGMSKKLLEE